MRRHIWQFLDGEATIYREDNNGNISGGPVAHACFFRGMRLNEILENTRRLVFGRAKKKITVRTTEYEAEIEEIYISKRLEYQAVKDLGRDTKLRIVFDFTDDAYSDIAPFDNDSWQFKKARRTKFEITGQDANDMIVSMSFSAEDVE